jgi:hypothetical protein
VVTIQGPFRRRPSVQELVAPGQVVAGRGERGSILWVELQYSHDGRDWVQCHHLLPTSHLVTGQAPADASELVLSAAERLSDEMLATAPA